MCCQKKENYVIQIEFPWLDDLIVIITQFCKAQPEKKTIEIRAKIFCPTGNVGEKNLTGFDFLYYKRNMKKVCLG